jgi:hypothetical protein
LSKSAPQTFALFWLDRFLFAGKARSTTMPLEIESKSIHESSQPQIIS